MANLRETIHGMIAEQRHYHEATSDTTRSPSEVLNIVRCSLSELYSIAKKSTLKSIFSKELDDSLALSIHGDIADKSKHPLLPSAFGLVTTPRIDWIKYGIKEPFFKVSLSHEQYNSDSSIPHGLRMLEQIFGENPEVVEGVALHVNDFTKGFSCGANPAGGPGLELYFGSNQTTIRARPDELKRYGPLISSSF